MFKGGFQCNLKEYTTQNYSEYIQRIIDFDQTLENIFNDYTGQFEEFKIYLKNNIFNNPDELQQHLTNIYNQWDTYFKVTLKRIEIFRLIMLMYLGLLERSFSLGGFYIIDMSSIKYTNNYISKQKLKCFQNYIKAFFLNCKRIQDDQVIFTKNTVKKEDFEKKFEQSNDQNIDFQFTQLKNEDHENSTVVDFADQNIGGLVFDTRNCAQEEIVMLIFPEATVSMIFIPQMKETEAVLIENLKKYSNYTGYEQSFQCSPSLNLQGNYNMLAIDAKPFQSENQFTKENIYRELIKCYAGFELSLKNSPNCYLSTGRWGCGIFRGNPYLKTLIQFLSFAIAVNQVNQKKSKIIINCVNDQSLFNFGVKLTTLLGQKGESILYMQNGLNEATFQNEENLGKIYTILTKDIQQIQEQLKNDDIIQTQGDQQIKQEEHVDAPIIEQNKESQMQSNQENNDRSHLAIGGVIIFAILVGFFVYKKVYK